MLENKSTNKTEITEIGEFGLIDRLTQNFKPENESTKSGVGDDAAVIKYEEGNTITSSDYFIEGVNFDITYYPLKHLGYKSVVTAISDIYAMNALAKQILVNIAVSNKYPIEALDEIYEGIHIACKVYGVDLVGGDFSPNTKGLSFCNVAIGNQKEEKIVYRKGAKHNDLLVVTGDLGAAYMGLLILEREKVTYEANPDFQPDLDQYQYLIEKQLKPEARKDIIEFFAEEDIVPSSMIDLSDGLASEVLHLSKKSEIGFHVYEDKIPIDPAVLGACQEFEINPTVAALNGGGDYELLFTIDQKHFDKIKNNPNFTVIGFATEKSKTPYIVTSGTEQLSEITAQGWK